MSEVRMPWEDDLAEDIESRRACMRAAAVEAYAAAAALCREAGCCCDRFVDSTAAYGNGPRNDGLQFRACPDGSFLVQRFVEIHDPRCPDALAARIEALGAPSKPRKGRKEK